MTRRKADASRGRRPAAEGPGSETKPALDAPDAPEAAVSKPPERKRRSRKKPARRPSAVDHVEVADDALATVVGLAAHEVPGVVGMAPASLSEGLRRILGVSQVDEGVEIERDAEGLANCIVLHVVVAYGVNIPAVAESVVERVRYAARTYAGIEVTDVKVHVAGVSRG
ncbi:MAG: Asp23/Gls24 family envelope stress response protein [Trueperaceae bacterium]